MVVFTKCFNSPSSSHLQCSLFCLLRPEPRETMFLQNILSWFALLKSTATNVNITTISPHLVRKASLRTVGCLNVRDLHRILEASENGEEGEGKAARIAAEIRALEYIGRRSAEAGGRRKRGKEGVQFRLGKEGQVQATEVHKSR